MTHFVHFIKPKGNEEMNVLYRLFLLCGLAVGLLWLTLNQLQASTTAATLCEEGLAGIYPCQNVHLLAHVPLSEMGAETEAIKGNDHWGWVDSASGREFVMFAMSNGVSFVEITNPITPTYLGKLPGTNPEQTSLWWDVKEYENYAFIVSDTPTTNGMQIFDLTQLLNVTTTTTFTYTAVYTGFDLGHNLWINEETGYLYAFRTSGDECQSGVHMLNIQDPLAVEFAGCILSGEPVSFDGHCMLYHGPDTTYTGREICFIGSDERYNIVDVTDKSQPTFLANPPIPTVDGMHMAHQPLLTPDQRYMLFEDKMDEMHGPTHTYIFDVSDLNSPRYIGVHVHETNATDHNMFIKNGFVYQSNFEAGLRVFNLTQIAQADLVEYAYFDTNPEDDTNNVNRGAYGLYPWWDDDIVTLSTIENGLFIVQVEWENAFLPFLTTP